MASYVRSMACLLALERTAFLTRGSGVLVESKRYVRGLRRKPVKVIFPENEIANVPKQNPAAAERRADAKVRESQPKVTSRTERPAGSGPAAERSGTVKSSIKYDLPPPAAAVAVAAMKDQIDGVRFERALPGDKRLARLVSVARSRTFREHQGKILLEGRRLICDALNAGADPQTVFFSKVERLRELPLDKLRRAALVKVKFEDIKIWSDLVAPQGVIAIFSRPDPSRLNFMDSEHSVPLSLICDNIRDPGNLGTMLRCAAAAGCQSVLLTKGCVDVWEPKVLRAAMGAHFRLPIYPSLNWGDIEHRLPKAATVHVADSSRGPATSEDTQHASLNASPRASEPREYGWVSSRPKQERIRYEEYESDSDGEHEGPSPPAVDARLYHENWAQSPTALVIGGETHGLSPEAVQLAETTAGNRLYVPVVPGVDSLNSAMAASVLLFEGRKQLLRLMRSAGRKSTSERRFS